MMHARVGVKVGRYSTWGAARVLFFGFFDRGFGLEFGFGFLLDLGFDSSFIFDFDLSLGS